MITGGTQRKARLLDSEGKLDMVQQALFAVASEFDWDLQAWAILANHYHFVATSPEEPTTLRSLVSKFHAVTARELNRMDNARGRHVWFQYWDSHIGYHRSYLARLNYVHNNPVHHGLVRLAAAYPWCSAAWFERNSSPAVRKTVASFKTDRLRVADDF